MGEAWQRFRRDRLALGALGVILLLVAVALGAPFLAPYDPSQQFFDGLTLEGAPLPPSARFWLGTDLLGRDLLSRLIFGARTSLMIGVAYGAIALLAVPVTLALVRSDDLAEVVEAPALANAA